MPKQLDVTDFGSAKGINLSPGVALTDAVNVSQLLAASGQPVRRFRKTGINAKFVGNTTVFTTDPSLGRFFVTLLNIRLTSATGFTVFATPPIYNLGFTASAYNDVYVAIDGLVTTPQNHLAVVVGNQIVPGVIHTQATSIPASTAVVLRVATASTVFSTYVVDVYVEGYYQPDAL